jgi:hypothetical protein
MVQPSSLIVDSKSLVYPVTIGVFPELKRIRFTTCRDYRGPYEAIEEVRNSS